MFPQSVREIEEYLASAGIAVDTILSLEPNSVGVSGTPTLFLVNKSGRIEKVWVGQLSTTEEQEVLRTLS